MEYKSTVEQTKMKKKVIYELAADGTCEFDDGESIRVSRTMLAIHSKFFMEKFFGSESETKIKIKGFGRASFKTFFDCLFGLKEYTLVDALVVYPIAHRYEVEESLDKCAAVLEPKHMTENVSHVLNMTTFYKCDELTDYVMNFVKTEYGIVKFLENKEYSFFLEPSAVIKLIEHVDLNSLVWTLVYQWGENYLKQREKSDIKSFFVKHGIFEKISLAHFESAKAIINFHVMSNKQLLCSDEILFHLETNTLEFDKMLPDRSGWVEINSGCSFSETIVFKNLLSLSSKEAKKEQAICILANKILIEPGNVLSAVLTVKARYIFRKIALNVDCQVSDTARPVRRNDLNFFYRETFTTMDYALSPFSSSDEISADLLGDHFKMPLFKFLLNARVSSEIHSFEIKYSFDFPCRILKASLDTNKSLIGENNLYFTRNVGMFNVQNE